MSCVPGDIYTHTHSHARAHQKKKERGRGRCEDQCCFCDPPKRKGSRGFRFALWPFPPLSPRLFAALNLQLAHLTRVCVCVFLLLSLFGRAVFCRDGDATSPTTEISLDSTEEVLSWARFVGQDLSSSQLEDSRKSVPFREFLLVLGARLGTDQDDSTMTRPLYLAPGIWI